MHCLKCFQSLKLPVRKWPYIANASFRRSRRKCCSDYYEDVKDDGDVDEDHDDVSLIDDVVIGAMKTRIMFSTLLIVQLLPISPLSTPQRTVTFPAPTAPSLTLHPELHHVVFQGGL